MAVAAAVAAVVAAAITAAVTEVAMVEAVFASLATAIDQYHRAGQKIPKRTGNAFANFNRAPYNVYEAKDGYVAIILVTEAQWQNLLRAMGREDLTAEGDPAADDRSGGAGARAGSRLTERSRPLPRLPGPPANVLANPPAEDFIAHLVGGYREDHRQEVRIGCRQRVAV